MQTSNSSDDFSAGPITEQDAAAPPIPDLTESYRRLSSYERSRGFNDNSLEALLHNKVRHVIQDGLECSHIVQELVTGHAEQEEWQSRRKEFLRPHRSHANESAKARLKHMQCRNAFMTLIDNVVFGSSQAFKRLFAA